MKPLVPIVPIAVWKELYAAAERYHDVRPWEVFGDRDVFGVRDPETGEVGYGMFMGSAGILYGFCLYKGPNGYGVYQRTMEGTIEVDEFYFVHDCLKLELGPKSGLQPEDLAVIKKLFLTFKGDTAWPEFRSLIPGCTPWFLTEREARFLTFALDAACLHAANVDSEEIVRATHPGMVYVYSAADKYRAVINGAWEPIPAAVPQPMQPVRLDPARMKRLRAKQTLPDTPWEVDVRVAPGATMDRERPYLMRLGIACQQSSGFVFAFETGPPEIAPHQLLADVVCTSIENHGFLPGTIYVKSAPESTALGPLAAELGFTLRTKSKLETIDMVTSEMRDHFRQGGGGTVH